MPAGVSALQGGGLAHCRHRHRRQLGSGDQSPVLAARVRYAVHYRANWRIILPEAVGCALVVTALIVARTQAAAMPTSVRQVGLTLRLMSRESGGWREA